MFLMPVWQLAAQHSGRIKGLVLDGNTKQSIPFANIVIQGTTVGSISDAEGVFLIEDVEEGEYTLEISFLGYATKEVSHVRVVRGKTWYQEIELEESSQVLQEVELKSYRYQTSITKLTPIASHKISREEIFRSPGSGGDIMRALSALPGIQSSGGQFSAIAVRGQGTKDNIFYVDDIPLNTISHFEGDQSGFNDPQGGRHSIFAPKVIESVKFLSGGFTSQYGRRSASVLDLNVKEGNQEDFVIDGQIDFGGGYLNYDGPLSKKKGINIFSAVRYQNFAPLLRLIDMRESGTASFTDAVMKITSKLNSNHKLTFVALYNPEQSERTVENVSHDVELKSNTIADMKRNSLAAGLKLRSLTGKGYIKNIVYYRAHDVDRKRGRASIRFDELGEPILTDIPYEDGIYLNEEKENEIGVRSIYTHNFENKSQLITGVEAAYVDVNFVNHLTRQDTLYTYGTNDFRADPDQQYLVIDPEAVNYNYKNNGVNL
jgi:hypothetical protein